MKLYNTLTKQIDDFVPQQEGRVSLYTCGPTVYDYLHVGNWTAYIYWDTLVRTLQTNHLTVSRVMNITDVGHLVSDADDGEDKLEKGARREGKTAWDVARFYTEDFLEGMAKLNLIAPTHITKATDFIDEQLALIRTLKTKGYTYQITDGIYFDTAKFPAYAEFAGLDLAAQKAGARVEFNEDKRSLSDFALWKFTPDGQMRDMQWATPLDLLDTPEENKMGFPGWHLECSAMAMSLLGSTIDIHTGGIDHIPVHHTNEIAQSEAASGQQFARYWLHCNHLKINGGKVSKSLGNGYTLQDLAEKGYAPMDLRLFTLQGHYQNEGNFTFENLSAAQNRLKNWRAYAAMRWQATEDGVHVSFADTHQKIMTALQANLDTPSALTAIDEAFARLDSQPLALASVDDFNELLDTIDTTLGIQLAASTPDISSEISELLTRREHARMNKDWQASDSIRDQLADSGVVVRDTAHGQIWHYR